jgi:hypothetical protein
LREWKQPGARTKILSGRRVAAELTKSTGSKTAQAWQGGRMPSARRRNEKVKANDGI